MKPVQPDLAATALIAEDEPLLALALRQELQALWPALRVLETPVSGTAAVQAALSRLPRIVFLDIRMPGMDGLEVAQALAEDWPLEQAPLPWLVFVTAYDQHAVAAFERAALDYVLKPVQSERLRLTCQRLQERLTATSQSPEQLLASLRGWLAPGQAPPPSPSADAAPLRILQASRGNTIHMVPLEQVIYFEAADKYVRAVTPDGEHLLRLPLRELQARLPADVFWQVHRSTLVRAEAIGTVQRHDNGKLMLTLRGHPDRVVVSRLYAHRFKAM